MSTTPVVRKHYYNVIISLQRLLHEDQLLTLLYVLQWLNRILTEMWPYYDKAASEMIKVILLGP